MDSKIHERLRAVRRGFTLIEVMVSVSIALLVMGFIIANYNSYNDVQTLKQAGLTLKNDLRFAQSNAMSGTKPTSTPPTPIPTPTPICTQLSGYTVSFTAMSYSIRALCNPEGPLGDIRSSTLPSGVTFSPIPTAITFNVLPRGTNLAGTTTIQLSGFGKQYSLQISSSGNVSD